MISSLTELFTRTPTVVVIGVALLLGAAMYGMFMLYVFFAKWLWTKPGGWRCPYVDCIYPMSTVAGFFAEYHFRLSVKRVDILQYIANYMFQPEMIQKLFTERFLKPLIDRESYRLRLGWQIGATSDLKLELPPRLLWCVLQERQGEQFVTDVPLAEELQAALHEEPVPFPGCLISINAAHEAMSDKLIEENYAMLTDEQKEEVLPEDRYQKLDEILAVAALKRRLDFLGLSGKERHESDYYVIDIERSGTVVKIRWTFKQGSPYGYDLLGFRRLGGFYQNCWDENNNGERVIDYPRDGETAEHLVEGQANYYTFFMRAWDSDTKPYRVSSLRFQITVGTKKETDAIDAILKRFEEKKDPLRQKMERALKELGLNAQFEIDVEKKLKAEIAKVESGNFSEAEKQDKIERLRQMAADIRSEI